MADTYPVHCKQLANGDLAFYNPSTGLNVFTFSVAASMPVLPTTDSLVAHAGGGQANATPLTTQLSRVITVATSGDSVVLPPSVAGMQLTVSNSAAANSMNVYPASATQGGVTGGDAINALGVNVAFSIAANKTAIFTCYTAGQWETILTA